MAQLNWNLEKYSFTTHNLNKILLQVSRKVIVLISEINQKCHLSEYPPFYRISFRMDLANLLKPFHCINHRLAQTLERKTVHFGSIHSMDSSLATNLSLQSDDRNFSHINYILLVTAVSSVCDCLMLEKNLACAEYFHFNCLNKKLAFVYLHFAWININSV